MGNRPCHRRPISRKKHFHTESEILYEGEPEEAHYVRGRGYSRWIFVAEVVEDGKLQDTVQVVAEDTIAIEEKEMNWVNSRMRKWALPQEEKVVSGAGTPETMKETT